jgi:hypothetical protein
MADIKISKEYFQVLKNILKIFNDIPEQREVLIFKKDNLVNITAMSLNTLVNIRTTSNHIDFDGDEIGMTSITEFINYLDAIDYIEDPDATLSSVEETSTKNKKIYSFLFKGKYGSYRMPVANLGLFDQKNRRTDPGSSKDTLKLVGKLYLTFNDTRLLVKNTQLMNKTDNFHLLIDDKIRIYMKGIQNQQFSRVFGDKTIMIYDNFTTKGADGNDFKIFSTKIFDYMSYFGCDFEVEIRNLPDANIMALKCRGKLKYDDPKIDEIAIYIGTQENSADVCASTLELVV